MIHILKAFGKETIPLSLSLGRAFGFGDWSHGFLGTTFIIVWIIMYFTGRLVRGMLLLDEPASMNKGTLVRLMVSST